MNSVETERALTSLIPAIKRDGAETALLKYASDRNLAPAQLEHLAQAYNKVLVIAHTKTAKERGDDVPILNTSALVAKYTDPDKGIKSASTVKSANTKVVPGSYRSYSVGNHFGHSEAKNMWMDFENDDKNHPEQVGTYVKAASIAQTAAQGMEDELVVREAQVLKDAALARWDSGLVKLAHYTRGFEDFVTVVQDARQISPGAAAVLENGLRTKLASLRLAWHGEVPADTRDFFIDRKKIAGAVSELEDAWFEATACHQVIHEIKSATTAEDTGKKSPPRMRHVDEIGADDDGDAPTSKAVDALLRRNDAPEAGGDSSSAADLRGDPDYKHDVQGNVIMNDDAPVLQDADKHYPSRVEREAAMLRLMRTPSSGVGNFSPPPGKDKEGENSAGLGSALGGITEGAGTSMKNLMTAISDYNPEDRGMGAAKGLSSIISAPREHAVSRLQGSIRTMRERATLQRLMLSDPVISAHDPAAVVEAFNTIRSVYPAAAGDINMARQLVRESLGYQGVPVSTVAQLADINKKTQPEKKSPVK